MIWSSLISIVLYQYLASVEFGVPPLELRAGFQIKEKKSNHNARFDELGAVPTVSFDNAANGNTGGYPVRLYEAPGTAGAPSAA
jgi:hypothetical protein